MKLLPLFELTIRPLPTSETTGVLSSELILRGISTGTVVKGLVMEAAVQWNDLILVFLTDDVPFEDWLRIYLIDQQARVIDQASLGSIYSTGQFGDLDLQPPDTLTFSFIGDTTWMLQLYAEEVFRIPVLADPNGVWRPLRLHRRFHLHGNPQPERT